MARETNVQSTAALTRPTSRYRLPDWLFSALVILGCLGAGELITHVLRVRVPGSVVGMLMLVVLLLWSGESLASRLRRTCNALISQLGLFFVPVGVGLMTVRDLLAAQWLAIVVALLVSFLIGLVAAAGAAYFAHRLVSRDNE